MSVKEIRLSVQTTLPEDYRSNGEFQRALEVLQDQGFYGLELNIAHPGNEPLDRIIAHLAGHGLKFTSFASGLTAKTYGLSLSHKDEEVRLRSVEKIREIISYLEGSDMGIILGFFKGPKAENQAIAQQQFRRSLEELAPASEDKKIPLVVEATNRYESSVANSLQDAVELVESVGGDYLKILPDTFHMNIEERDMYGALKNYAPYYNNIHLSENNRYFPGYGAIDFEKIFTHLKSIGYTGGFALEGNIKASLTQDSMVSMNMIKKYTQGRRG